MCIVSVYTGVLQVPNSAVLTYLYAGKVVILEYKGPSRKLEVA